MIKKKPEQQKERVIPRKEENKLVNLSEDRIRSLFRQTIYVAAGAERPGDFMATIKSAYSELTTPRTEEEINELSKTIMKAIETNSLETHYLLSKTVDTEYKTLVIDLATQLTEEFRCETASEKVLAEIAASAFVRVLHYSAELVHAVDLPIKISANNGFCAVMSKEVDRASRQYISAVMALRQLKDPPLEINVKAKTAFVSQNQQVNLTQHKVDIPNKKTNDPQ